MANNTTDFEEQVRIGINSSEIASNLKTVEKSVEGVNSAFQSVSAQVDAVIKHIENLTVAAAKAGTTVNKTFNNANTYTTNQNITRVSAGGKNKQTIKAGDTIMAFDKTDKSSAATNARQEGVKALKKQNDLLDEQLRKAKELTKVEEKRAELLGEKAKNYSRDSESKSKNAEANLLNAQTKSKYPFLFGTGANNRNWRYQSGKMLQNIGNTASSLGTGGRLAGYALDSAGALLKAPAMGTASAVSNLVKAVADLGKEAVKAYSEIESIKTQLGVVFSNQTQANSMFGEISQYAVKSPFGVQQTSELAVLLKQSGVYATDLMDTLKMIGDTAGGNMEKMKRIANNYAQIVSIGKASMLDMRQFAYAGIPIFEAVSKELGVSQQELRKLISDGKVTSDIIEKVFKDLTGINGIFENATEKGAKTLKARLQNLSDARQLAFSQIGQGIVGLGTQTGNDSYANRMVSWAEDLYSKLNDWFGRGNIAADVATIARRNDRIKQLEDLIAINKGNEEALKYLQAALDRELAKIDVDAQRATYEASYNEKKTKHDEVRNIFGDLSLKDAKNRLYNMQDWYSTDYFSRSYLKDDERYKNFSMLDDVALQEQISLLKEFIKALKDEKEITVEELQAHRESNVINAQQLAFDQANKSAGKQGSYTAGFEKLYSLYTSGDKYKLEQQKKETEWLEDSKKVLKELLEYKDSNGNIDITKMTFKKLNEYLDEEKRVLDAGRKLTVVEGKSQDTMTADRAVLTEQYKDIYTKVEEELRKQGGTEALVARNELGRINRNINYDADNKTFFREFSHILNDELSIFDSLIENAKTDKDQEFYKDLRKTLLASTFQYEAPSEKGLEADTNATTNAANTNFIPLWKRILSSATGLTTNGMTSTQQTMTNYRDDMAIRNMASGVLSATMKSMGIDTAMSLMRTNRSVQLTGDNGKTYQIDWVETKKAMKDFATQLSASTEVITAYKNGLQAELDTYEQLIAAGYTQAESTDLGSQKFVSSKQLAKLGLGNESQLVNAFGEILTTASGKQYNVADVTFKNGQMFDKVGKPIEEEVVITGKLFEFIKGELPRLRDEIHEATAAELNNNLLKTLWNQIAGNQYLMKYVQENGYTDRAGLMLQNPEYVTSFLDSAITKLKNQDKYKDMAVLSNDDIIIDALVKYENERKRLESEKQRILGSEEFSDSFKKHSIEAIDDEIESLYESMGLVTDAFKMMDENVSKVTDSWQYGGISSLGATTERDTAVLKELFNVAQLIKGLDYNANNPENAKRLFTYSGDIITASTQLKPEDYEGKRGDRNRILSFLFGPQDKDMEDLYLDAAKTANIEGKSVNQFGIDASRFQNMSDEDILGTGGLDNAEKQMIKIKSLALDVVKTFADFRGQVSGLTRELGKKAFITPFEKMGECLVNGKDWGEEMGKAMEQLGAEALSALGPLLQQAGMALVEMGAKKGSWGIVMAGLGLAAAGGFAAGIGGALSSAEKNEDDNDKEAEKIESLKDELEKLLEQARSDALYYEHNLRHKTALGINKDFSHQSVNDAIITPQGKVVTTDPKDYLIATKTPNQLVGGGASVSFSPVINCNVVNNTSSKVTQQQRQNADGSIDIITMIEDAVGDYIASPRSDNAFESREYRLSGQQMVM